MKRKEKMLFVMENVWKFVGLLIGVIGIPFSLIATNFGSKGMGVPFIIMSIAMTAIPLAPRVIFTKMFRLATPEMIKKIDWILLFLQIGVVFLGVDKGGIIFLLSYIVMAVGVFFVIKYVLKEEGDKEDMDDFDRLVHYSSKWRYMFHLYSHNTTAIIYLLTTIFLHCIMVWGDR